MITQLRRIFGLDKNKANWWNISSQDWILQIRLSADLYSDLEEIANRRKVTVEELFRELVQIGLTIEDFDSQNLSTYVEMADGLKKLVIFDSSRNGSKNED